MSEATIVQCPAACTVVVEHQITFPPFNITAEEAGQIGSAILLIWAMGFVIRSLIRAVKSDGVQTEENQ